MSHTYVLCTPRRKPLEDPAGSTFSGVFSHVRGLQIHLATLPWYAWEGFLGQTSPGEIEGVLPRLNAREYDLYIGCFCDMVIQMVVEPLVGHAGSHFVVYILHECVFFYI